VVDTARDIVRNQIHELKGLNNKVIIEVADQQIR
jgi:hypothetical protein